MQVVMVTDVRHKYRGTPDESHDPDGFFKEKAEYSVPDTDGDYFCKMGWAHKPGEDPVPMSKLPVDLHVHDGVIEVRRQD